ncbi:MAG: hypothetical protein WD534_01195 [Phycisphaeraceae bacterium]
MNDCSTAPRRITRRTNNGYIQGGQTVDGVVDRINGEADPGAERRAGRFTGGVNLKDEVTAFSCVMLRPLAVSMLVELEAERLIKAHRTIDVDGSDDKQAWANHRC